jgi:hypothetical protein
MNVVPYDHAVCCSKRNAAVHGSTTLHIYFLSPQWLNKAFSLNFRTGLTEMDFFYTPTTVFEIVQFDEIEFATAILKTEKRSSYHKHLQHEPYGVELVGAPPTLCTTSDEMYGITQIAAPEQPGDLGCQVESCFGQIVSFRTKIDPTSEIMMCYDRAKIYSKHE